MPVLEPVDSSQNEDNLLTQFAEAERKKLLTKNDYTTSNQYSATNPDAIADGDEKGKGTGNFLDVYNQTAGNKTDTVERKNEIKINKYNSSKTYPDF